MTNTVGQKEENFPIFELGYSDTLTGGSKFVRSSQGMLFLQLTSGGAFNWISLRIVSSRIPLKLRYKCIYKHAGTEIDATAEASDGQQCPQGDSRYIKKIAIESKVYYRCWLTRDQHPDEYERDPAGMFWYGSGRFCGTEEDNRWITALEIKMPPWLTVGGLGKRSSSRQPARSSRFRKSNPCRFAK
jgi:hypothetical protein